MIKTIQIIFFSLLLSLQSLRTAAQHERTQLPFFLSDHTYFEATLSYINYNFTNLQMEKGYTAESIHIPHTGVRLMLYAIGLIRIYQRKSVICAPFYGFSIRI